jgi:hypothetical protein
MKTTLSIIALIVIVAAGFFVFNSRSGEVASNYKDAKYLIDGKEESLGGALSYFGNDLKTDLNNDGREDVVFLVTDQAGGSGTFFYAVAALNTENGYIGSDGYFLGDRIAPQNIELSRNAQHKNVVVVNYADRKSSDPMTIEPSVGKSAYLKLDTLTMQWGIVEPNFEGESR